MSLMNNPQREAQLKLYGGEAGYRLEMKRRSALRKNSVGGFSNIETAKLAQKLSVEKRLANKKATNN